MAAAFQIAALTTLRESMAVMRPSFFAPTLNFVMVSGLI